MATSRSMERSRAPTSGSFGSSSFAVRRLDGMPLFALRVTIPGGTASEERPGQAWLAAQMLGEGTRRRDWQRLSTELEERGVALSCAVGVEAHGLVLDGLAGDWLWALEAAAEMVLENEPSPERCAWMRQQGLAELESLSDQADVVAGWHFLDQLYRPHPAGRPIYGDAGGLAALEVADCRAFHRRAIERGLVITVAGDVDEETVARAIESRFASGASRASAVVATVSSFTDSTPVGLGPGSRRVTVPAHGQSHLFAGHLTVDRFHPEVPALEALSVILGASAGLAGRLPTRLREEEGLTYATEVSLLEGAGRVPGRLSIYCACPPDREGEAVAAIREELTRIRERPPTEQEAERARSYLLGRRALGRETARQWCDLLAESLIYGQPVWNLAWHRGRLDVVDTVALARAARGWIEPEALRITLGTPARGPHRGPASDEELSDGARGSARG